jgi:uncharacterized membrane protein
MKTNALAVVTVTALTMLVTAPVAHSNSCIPSDGGCGFLYSDGTFTTLTGPPGSIFTIAYGINNKGQIVGAYGDPSFPSMFLYSRGTYTTLSNPPGAGPGTYAVGINNKGEIAGYYPKGGRNYGYIKVRADSRSFLRGR